MRGYIALRCATVVQTLVIMHVRVKAPFGAPTVTQNAAVFLLAYLAAGAAGTGVATVMIFPDIARGCRMHATGIGA
jgi:hypothetical protein